MKWNFATLFILCTLSSLAQAGSVAVDVTLFPAGSFVGKASDVKGFAVLNGNEISAQDVRVNLKSFKTDVPMRDNHAQKTLETDKYPEALLISAKGKGGIGQGRIKIRGIEKDIQGKYEINGNQLTAHFKLKLPDFKITDVSFKGIGVEDDVVLHVTLPLKKGPK